MSSAAYSFLAPHSKKQAVWRVMTSVTDFGVFWLKMPDTWLLFYDILYACGMYVNK
jgi:hypothetical protein